MLLTSMSKIKRITVGIDPGKNTGYAEYDRVEKRLTVLLTLDFVSTINRLRSIDKDTVYAVVIEVPMTKINWHGPKAAHDVGRVCRESELLAAMIIDMGFNVITQHPKGKICSKRFDLITGWKGRSNQHCRDAAMLAFGL